MLHNGHIEFIDANGYSSSYHTILSFLRGLCTNCAVIKVRIKKNAADVVSQFLLIYGHGGLLAIYDSVVPAISSITVSPVNSNSAISDWGIYVYGKSKATIGISGAAGVYGSTIKSYSITTSPSVGSTTASSFTTGTIYSYGTITVTAKVTDTRGRTATKTTTFYVYYYAAPYFSSVEAYRCNSSGTQDDATGTYAY